jgi:hypothetical protein
MDDRGTQTIQSAHGAEVGGRDGQSLEIMNGHCSVARANNWRGTMCRSRCRPLPQTHDTMHPRGREVRSTLVPLLEFILSSPIPFLTMKPQQLPLVSNHKRICSQVVAKRKGRSMSFARVVMLCFHRIHRTSIITLYDTTTSTA